MMDVPKIHYKDLPENYTHNEQVVVFGVELSGIQKFIFNVTENKGSLRQIKENSLRIETLTDDLFEKIQTIHDVRSDEIVTKTSGKIYFIAKKETNVDALTDLLERLQKDVYLSFEGELRLYHAHVLATISEKPDGDVNAYRALKDRLAKMRRQNYTLLDVDGDTEYEDLRRSIQVKNATTIDQLIKPDQTHRYITGIKLDFDDLGAYFGSIGNSDEIQSVSEQMMQKIDEVIEGIDGIYKVFVGGDDIFILSNFYRFMEVALALKSKLQEAFADFDYDFGVSAGIVHFKEKTSIVYYGEQLETELENAKQKGKNRVSMENTCFEWGSFERLVSTMRDILQKYGKSSGKSSQLVQFENTMKAIVGSDEPIRKKVRAFLLKIPLFEDRLRGFVPKTMLSLDLNRFEEYYEAILRLYFATKYARRLMEKE